jgi:hypothetical protein
MRGSRRLANVRLVDFSRQLKTLIDKAQRLRDEINRSIIATTPRPADRVGHQRRVVRPRR